MTSFAPEPKSASTDPGSADDLADVVCTVTDRSDDLALRERGAGSLPRARRALHAPASHPGGTSPRSRARAQRTPKPADRADESRILSAEHVAVDCAASAHADDPALLERGVGRRRSPCERLPRPHATSVTKLFHLDLEPAPSTRPCPYSYSTSRSASPPISPKSSALPQPALTISLCSSAAPAAAAHRANASRAR